VSNGLGRLLDRDTPRAASLYPVRAETSTRTVRSWAQDGAWLDQDGYGTCVAHAFGHRRADGPLKVDGITEAWAKKFYLEASAFYWGTPDTTMQKGTSGLSAAQALLKRGAIDKFEWVSSPEAFRYALLERGSLCMGIDWYRAMDVPKPVTIAGRTAYYLDLDDMSYKRGGHEILINKIDLNPLDGFEPYCRIKNSWGTDWGQHGTARIRLSDMDDFISKGWVDLILIHELPRAA
jgi:hypothetical protein